MTDTAQQARDEFAANALEATIRIGLVIGLAAYCFDIIRPFVAPVVWGAIIAVASRAFYTRLEQWTGGRSGLAAGIFALVGLLLIIGPLLTLTGTIVDGVQLVGAVLQEGKLGEQELLH